MKLRSALGTLATILFTSSGRINRREFWLIGTLLAQEIIAASYALMFADIFLIIEIANLTGERIPPAIGIAWVVIISTGIIIFGMWTAIAVSIKRWHDIGLSELMVLLLWIPFVNYIVWIVLGIIPGQETDNKYGPIPLKKTNKGSVND